MLNATRKIFLNRRKNRLREERE